SILPRLVNQFERFIKRPRDLIAVTAFQALLYPRGIDFNPEKNRTVHRRGERLRATHAAEAAGQNEFSVERPTEVFSPGSGKSFKRTLDNSLTTDVNPRTGRHLSVHRQSHSLEAIELGIVIPLTNKIGVGDQNTRRFVVRPEFPNRLSGLHEKRFVI